MIELTSIQETANALLQNKIGVFPCDTIWGIIAVANDKNAKAIRKLKGKTTNDPFIVLIQNKIQLNMITTNISNSHHKWLDEYWPGPVTFVLPKASEISDIITGGRSSIGVRMPEFEPLQNLLNLIDTPIISTSANLSGHPEIQTIAQLPPNIPLNFAYTNATPPLSEASTVVDLSNDSPQLLRQGATIINF